MEIIKIVSIAVIGAIFFFYLKSVNSELSGLLCLGTGILILIISVEYVISAISFFKEFISTLGITSSILLLVVKITIIAYLIEFSKNLCEDLGSKSLGSKVDFAGRIIIFVTSIPIFTSLIKTLTELIVWKKHF